MAAGELGCEAKGAAADRPRAPEEGAGKERQRRGVRERERVKRMRGVWRPTNDDDEEGVGAGLDESLMARGGYAARRAKIRAKQGDDSEDEDDDSDDEDEQDGDELQGSSTLKGPAPSVAEAAPPAARRDQDRQSATSPPPLALAPLLPSVAALAN